MDHTTNYDLNQWEADDRVTRADFNADNQKLDAALAAIAAAASGGAKIVTGTWTGDGVNNRTITLPAAPKLMIVLGYGSNGTSTIGSIYFAVQEIVYMSAGSCGALRYNHLSGNQYTMEYAQYGNNANEVSYYTIFF